MPKAQTTKAPRQKQSYGKIEERMNRMKTIMAIPPESPEI